MTMLGFIDSYLGGHWYWVALACFVAGVVVRSFF